MRQGLPECGTIKSFFGSFHLETPGIFPSGDALFGPTHRAPVKTDEPGNKKNLRTSAHFKFSPPSDIGHVRKCLAKKKGFFSSFPLKKSVFAQTKRDFFIPFFFVLHSFSFLLLFSIERLCSFFLSFLVLENQSKWRAKRLRLTNL
jgi:hypothetical protein